MSEFTNALANMVLQDKIIVDEHTTDQLLVYMALAKGKSIIHTGKITGKSQHTITQIAIIGQFLPQTNIKITNITEQLDFGNMDKYEVNQIEIHGIGYNGSEPIT